MALSTVDNMQSRKTHAGPHGASGIAPMDVIAVAAMMLVVAAMAMLLLFHQDIGCMRIRQRSGMQAESQDTYIA